MKLCRSDLQKLGEKPLPSTADVPEHFISHAVQNAQGICHLNHPALPGDGCLPAVVCGPWCSETPWGMVAPSLVTPILGDTLGKERFSAAEDRFLWEGPACRCPPPPKRQPSPLALLQKSTSQLAGISLPKDISKDSHQAPRQVIAQSQSHSQRHPLKLTLIFCHRVSLQLEGVTAVLSHANVQGLISQEVYLKHV